MWYEEKLTALGIDSLGFLSRLTGNEELSDVEREAVNQVFGVFVGLSVVDQKHISEITPAILVSIRIYFFYLNLFHLFILISSRIF